MKNKNIKRLLMISVCVMLLAAAGITAFALSGYNMTYDPGTTDTVTDLPETDFQNNGSAYTVSNIEPKRQGYEFLGWKLDYASEMTEYTVYHRRASNGEALFFQDGSGKWTDHITGTGAAGETVSVSSVDFEDCNFVYCYVPNEGLVYTDPAELTLSADKDSNEVIFYYEGVETVYEVWYLDENDSPLIAPVQRDGETGATITEIFEEISGYVLDESRSSEEITLFLQRDPDLNKIFFYYREKPHRY